MSCIFTDVRLVGIHTIMIDGSAGELKQRANELPLSTKFQNCRHTEIKPKQNSFVSV